ncbi:apolipoprotein N-acyltransferase [Acinetobacter sp. c3-l95]|uniref:apolipoprotein N-acyltransferase n=1 Tax=Acinetobacter sp. c3-l95 TaxID=3342804 RepID=UPI0035BA7844
MSVTTNTSAVAFWQQASSATLSLKLIMLLALIAGLMFPLSLAPYHQWWIALLSPALLYLCLYKRSSRHTLWIGWSYGFGLWFTGAFWLYPAIHFYGNIAAPIAVFLIALLAVTMGAFTAVQTWAYRRFFPETPLTFAPLWVAFEWLKTWLFTGFPWLFVGYAFTEYGLDNYAPALGVYAVSFMAILIATGIIEILRGKRFWLIPIALVLIGAFALKSVTWTTAKNEAPLSVSLVQGNISQDLKWQEQYRFETLNIYSRLSQNEWGRDLVVWPEAAIPLLQTQAQPFINELSQHAKASGSVWISGIPYFDEKNSSPTQPLFYNAIMANGGENGLYFKQRLVPFGEYIPLSGLLSWLLPALQEDITGGNFSAGDTQQSHLNIKQRALSVAICYEVAYPNLTRQNAQNSDFLITISNDAWFKGSAGPWQHLQMVQMRAKENGRWIIRGTNTGVTAIINEQGKIVHSLPMDVEGVLRADLPSYQGQTLYSKLGDVPILVFSALLLLLGLYFRPKVVDLSFKKRR